MIFKAKIRERPNNGKEYREDDQAVQLVPPPCFLISLPSITITSLLRSCRSSGEITVSFLLLAASPPELSALVLPAAPWVEVLLLCSGAGAGAGAVEDVLRRWPAGLWAGGGAVIGPNIG